MIRWNRTLRSLPVALLCATIAQAQEAPSLDAGTRVLVVVPQTTRDANRLRCESTIVRSAGDTLLLSRPGTCPLGMYLGEISVLRADHGSRWKHAAIGLAGGAAIGAVIAKLTVKDDCGRDPCDDFGLGSAVDAVGDVMAGAVAGVLVGTVLPAGKRWHPAQAARLLRVGSVTLHPDVRLSLRPHGGTDRRIR